MLQFHRFIADYKDSNGNDYHQVLIVPDFFGQIPSKKALHGVKDVLEGQGYHVVAITEVFGNYSFEDLYDRLRRRDLEGVQSVTTVFDIEEVMNHAKRR